MMLNVCRVRGLIAVFALSWLLLPLSYSQSDAELEARLTLADKNRPEIERAMKNVPAEQRAGMWFLIENMPQSDLQTLHADYLLKNVALAYEARQTAKWGSAIPEDVFLNEVLPYANINERRDEWRQEFRTQFLPLVRDLDRPGLAAARLNQVIFKQLNVQYSTKRKRADQGPRESIESGLASCTGLSILLIDACRSVGIPARFVGTPLWSDKSGNHSWVEVWDDGWHFTGAAEAAGDNLDQAWFIDRAGTANADAPEHAIYAVSFKKTPLIFPMVWDRNNRDVFAVNVTDRYLKREVSMPEGFIRMRFKTLGPVGTDRCQANLTIRDSSGKVVFRGQSKDERFDANDHVTTSLAAGEKYVVEVRHSSGVSTEEFLAAEDGKLITIKTHVPTTAVNQLIEYLKQPMDKRKPLIEEEFANVPLSAEEARSAEQLLWEDHVSQLKQVRQAEMKEKIIRAENVEMPFEFKVFGQRPAAGHCLVISMHGGGGAPKQVNDRQWENQKSLYELDEGIYVAPRGPTDTWNLWHQSHIDVLFTRLIENFVALEGVDPSRIYLTGYSAGGDGVYQLAPRMADQFAAAAMMAGHPNETRPLGLRNLPFTLHVGGKDAAYNRNSIAQSWADELGKLRTADPLGYEHWAKIYPEKGHWMDREDREGVKWMMSFRRNMTPDKVVWLQDDVVHDRFYWLACDPTKSKQGDLTVVARNGNEFTIEQASGSMPQLLLRDGMVDLDQEIIVKDTSKILWSGKVKRTMRTIVQTLERRGDPEAIFSAKIELP